MSSYDLGDLFKTYVSELAASLKASRGILWHPGQKGGVVEDRYRRFLRKILPQRLGVSEGVIYATDGSQSAQCDIIIYDQHQTPIIFEENGTRAIPIETVFAVCEIKSSVTRQHLKDALASAKQIRTMPRTAIKASGPITKQFMLSEPTLELFPVLYYIFSVESNTFNAISTEFKNQYLSEPIGETINLVHSLEDGVLCYLKPNSPGVAGAGLCSYPTPGSHTVRSLDDNHGLLAFGLFLDLVLVAETYRDLNFIQYFTNKQFNIQAL